MKHHLIKVLAVGLLSGLAWTTSAYGTPGERFHIKEDNTGIHEDPSATASVVRHLNKGDRVIEFRRQGSWVKVSQLGAVGKGGWVEISRLAPEPRNSSREQVVRVIETPPKEYGIYLQISDPDMLNQVREALQLLKTQAPEHYEFVKNNINIIREAPRSAMNVESKIFDLSAVSANVSPEWTASIIFHDAVHVDQYESGQLHSVAVAEKSANEQQLELLKTIGAPPGHISHLENIIAQGNYSDLNNDGIYTQEDYDLRNW